MLVIKCKDGGEFEVMSRVPCFYQDSILGSAIELEHAEFYETASDLYLLFHLWLNKKVPDNKRRLYSSLDMRDLK